MDILFFVSVYVVNNAAFMHHNKAIAVADGVFHIVRYHKGGKLVAVNYFFGKVEHFLRRFGIEGGGMLVQKQQSGFLECRHKQGQCLALAARQKPYFCTHAVFQAQAQDGKFFAVQSAFGATYTPAQGAPFAAAVREGKVLFYLHCRGRSAHGVLVHAAEKGGTLVFF